MSDTLPAINDACVCVCKMSADDMSVLKEMLYVVCGKNTNLRESLMVTETANECRILVLEVSVYVRFKALAD